MPPGGVGGAAEAGRGFWGGANGGDHIVRARRDAGASAAAGWDSVINCQGGAVDRAGLEACEPRPRSVLAARRVYAEAAARGPIKGRRKSATRGGKAAGGAGTVGTIAGGEGVCTGRLSRWRGRARGRGAARRTASSRMRVPLRRPQRKAVRRGDTGHGRAPAIGAPAIPRRLGMLWMCVGLGTQTLGDLF